MPLKPIKLVNQKDFSELPIPLQGGILGRNEGFAVEYFRRSRFMSGAHLYIFPQGDSYFAVDKNSRSDLVLNDQIMIEGREYLLGPGDNLILADMVFEVALDILPDEQICLNLSENVKTKVVGWSADAIASIGKAYEQMACERYTESIESSGEAIYFASRAIINIAGKDCEEFFDIIHLIEKLVKKEVINSEFYNIIIAFFLSQACDLTSDFDPDDAAIAAAAHRLSLDLLNMLRDVLFNPNQHYIKV